MTLALLIAGIFAVVAGLLAILFGIPVKEFSFGNTLILVGAIGVCSGMLLIGLSAVVQELKKIARRLGSAGGASEVRVRPVLPPGLVAPTGVVTDAAATETMKAEPPSAPSLPPWQDEAAARELIARKDARDLYELVIAKVNVGLAQFERIKRFALLPREFTIERGELTPTLKVKRRVVEERYREVIDGLYE